MDCRNKTELLNGRKNRYGFEINDCEVILNPCRIVVHKDGGEHIIISYARLDNGKISAALDISTATEGMASGVSAKTESWNRLYDTEDEAVLEKTRRAEDWLRDRKSSPAMREALARYKDYIEQPRLF